MNDASTIRRLRLLQLANALAGGLNTLVAARNFHAHLWLLAAFATLATLAAAFAIVRTEQTIRLWRRVDAQREDLRRYYLAALAGDRK